MLKHQAMNGSIRWIISVLITVWAHGAVSAQNFVQFERSTTVICDVLEAEEPPPDSASSRCGAADAKSVDLHRKAVWIVGDISVPQSLLNGTEPIGLFISAKAASRAVLNGRPLPANGRPGLDKVNEVPGQIDTVTYVARDQLEPDGNRVAVLLSGHHSLIGSTRDILMIGFFPFQQAPHHELDTAYIGMLMLGIFALTALYVGVIARFAINQTSTLTLAATALFAAGQVIAETLRSFWSYPYFVHDLRLIAMVVCGLGVGLTLFAHTLTRFEIAHRKSLMAIALGVSALGVLCVQGFDEKASTAILVPTTLAAIIALAPFGIYSRLRLAYGAVFALFSIVNVVDPGGFLDTHYFVLLGSVVLFLAVFQAVAFVDAVKQAEKGKQVGRQLEELLYAKGQADNPPFIARHAGITERFETHGIANLEAAGDYVTLKLLDGREVMITGSLTSLEGRLPASFLRVHRSHIVNANHVASLQRLPTGSGEMKLATGTLIPVSRRAMPKVRKSIQEL